MRRTIMIFPEIEEGNPIELIREKYDPLYKCVRPHLTLVFTFESSLTTDEIKAHLKTALRDIPSFDLAMDKIVKIDNPFGKYLFLLVDEGLETIKTLSSKLYTGLLSPYKPDWLNEKTYLPHMTLGVFESEEALEMAYESIDSKDLYFKRHINKVSVEIIGEDEASIIEFEIDLK
jgi:2'-5' RNA ligase